MMLAGHFKPLLEYEKLGREALLFVPARRQEGESIAFPVNG